MVKNQPQTEPNEESVSASDSDDRIDVELKDLNQSFKITYEINQKFNNMQGVKINEFQNSEHIRKVFQSIIFDCLNPQAIMFEQHFLSDTESVELKKAKSQQSYN